MSSVNTKAIRIDGWCICRENVVCYFVEMNICCKTNWCSVLFFCLHSFRLIVHGLLTHTPHESVSIHAKNAPTIKWPQQFCFVKTNRVQMVRIIAQIRVFQFSVFISQSILCIQKNERAGINIWVYNLVSVNSPKINGVCGVVPNVQCKIFEWNIVQKPFR